MSVWGGCQVYMYRGTLIRRGCWGHMYGGNSTGEMVRTIPYVMSYLSTAKTPKQFPHITRGIARIHYRRRSRRPHLLTLPLSSGCRGQDFRLFPCRGVAVAFFCVVECWLLFAGQVVRCRTHQTTLNRSQRRYLYPHHLS